jgi:hypothetical protein
MARSFEERQITEETIDKEHGNLCIRWPNPSPYRIGLLLESRTLNRDAPPNVRKYRLKRRAVCENPRLPPSSTGPVTLVFLAYFAIVSLTCWLLPTFINWVERSRR